MANTNKSVSSSADRTRGNGPYMDGPTTNGECEVASGSSDEGLQNNNNNNSNTIILFVDGNTIILSVDGNTIILSVDDNDNQNFDKYSDFITCGLCGEYKPVDEFSPRQIGKLLKWINYGNKRHLIKCKNCLSKLKQFKFVHRKKNNNNNINNNNDNDNDNDNDNNNNNNNICLNPEDYMNKYYTVECCNSSIILGDAIKIYNEYRSDCEYPPLCKCEDWWDNKHQIIIYINQLLKK